MAEPWKKICANCRHLNDREPNHHCFMFRDEPDGPCMQNTSTMDKAKQTGKALTPKQVSELLK